MPQDNNQHFKVLIVGGGTGGISVAARLSKKLPAGSIGLIEPSDKHWYQPLFTLVGGGAANLSEACQPMATLIPQGVNWIRDAVQSFEPETSSLQTSRGRISYDYLIVAMGIKVDWDGIPGLVEAIQTGCVSSNYSENYVNQTWDMIRTFKGGDAIFTFPSTPVKCAGAPQKIMYLADETFRRNGVRNQSNVRFFCAVDKIFSVKKYADSLLKVVERRQIQLNFKHDLIAIDGRKRLATFKNVGDQSIREVPFTIAHVTPPMGAPTVIKSSALAATTGFVDVDRHTLRHNRFGNVFALGDCANLPTSKTGAAIRKQAPIVASNLLALMNRMANVPIAQIESQLIKYDGYTSCPLVTNYGKLILAEFNYNLEPTETFPFDQSKERTSMYYLKRYALPQLYWRGMLKGLA